MNTPRFALAALISALAAAPAVASLAAPLVPILKGPAGPGQCVIGSDGCGFAPGFFDPTLENVLGGDLGQRVAPLLDSRKPRQIAANSASDDSDAAQTDLIALGKIINPRAGTMPSPAASGMTLGASTADGASETPTIQIPKVTDLSYVKNQEAERKILGENATASSLSQ